MIESSENHPEYMDLLRKNNPAKDRIIDQDDAWYFKDTMYVSNSMLKVFQSGGIKNYDAYLKGEMKKESSAFDFGSAFHCLILEPEEFNKRFFIMDDTKICEEIGGARPRSTNKYKDWYEKNYKHIEEDPNKTILSLEDMELLSKLENALHDVPEAISLLEGCNEFETIYSNTLEGVKTKSKIDGIRYDDYIIDLKTTTDSVKHFRKTCSKYNYAQQAAFYADTTGVERFFFIVVEKNYPYNVGIFEAGTSFMQEGRESYIKGLNELNYFISNKGFNPDKFYFKQILY